MITTQDICISFDQQDILTGVSATFHTGKTNLVIGKSGSGKTVFLKCLLQLLHPTQGTILYDDVDINDLSVKEIKDFKKKIGVVFQGNALFDSMTLEENIMFPLKVLNNIPIDEMQDQVNLLLDRVQMTNTNHKMPSEISGGMKRRIAVARAIILNPNYLFCDEPNSGLDPYMSSVIDDLLQGITQEYNMTTIINTHDINSIFQIGEHIILIKEGKKAWEGNHQDLKSDPNQDIHEYINSSKSFKNLGTS